MSEVLRFSTNLPVEVALRRDSGRRVEGHYGDQMMYTLDDERVMYVPLLVSDRIRELDIRRGEPFEICKAEVKSGNRRWIEWQVRRLQEPQQPSSSANAPAAAAPALTEAQNHRHAATSGPSNGSSGTRFEAAATGILLPVPVAGPGVAAMEMALQAAAEIAGRVENRAALCRYPLHFSSEDVRAIGLTMFIQATRDGGGRWES
ncbi:MAG: hypothetical protein LLG20_25590 [Acidobacteriales bacterium]|nr:hypothetical protein [Terriglobales bacterium]